MSASIDRRDSIIEHLVGTIEARGLQGPAILFLEANKPFSFLGSQLLLLLQPLSRPFGGGRLFSDWAQALEDRETVERIIERLESGK